MDTYSGGFLHPDSVMAINPFLIIVAVWSWVKWLSVSTLIIGGASYIGYLFTPDWREIVDSKHYYSNWKIRVYLSLPFNTASRVIGGLANQEIPIWLREHLLGGFARIYDCRMEECVDPDFKNYRSFAAFFNRKLRESTRPISASPLVSPADGTVLHFGKVEENKIEYVKETARIPHHTIHPPFFSFIHPHPIYNYDVLFRSLQPPSRGYPPCGQINELWRIHKSLITFQKSKASRKIDELEPQNFINYHNQSH
ncbi:hypothetical protein GCK72_008664 [Caenorhabditis remanei]|uniref:Uncharacterized protein n=1 Tax=Caenorhabditis remanei TaxID=31234 RepID=A0A6A5H0L7_CAERE|nr:hypothetical protein GCK72_008664 [Caenorhabditis remanei]KAF1760415.1 hypothetical protein GCK72_008664 [Caenorhabditis remanei]